MPASVEQTSSSNIQDDRKNKLPRNNKEYGKKLYWDERFAQEDNFEWLVGYKQVASQLSQFLKSSDKILVVGCGNSNFSSDLYDAGYLSIINIDFSQVVIDIMKEKNKDRTQMEWKVRGMNGPPLVVKQGIFF
jgi:2-polyprenyl-3-methyl-5-hydroxy-6-metoxy-1,4-benzoquinol methylase